MYNQSQFFFKNQLVFIGKNTWLLLKIVNLRFKFPN